MPKIGAINAVNSGLVQALTAFGTSPSVQGIQPHHQQKVMPISPLAGAVRHRVSAFTLMARRNANLSLAAVNRVGLGNLSFNSASTGQHSSDSFSSQHSLRNLAPSTLPSVPSWGTSASRKVTPLTPQAQFEPPAQLRLPLQVQVPVKKPVQIAPLTLASVGTLSLASTRFLKKRLGQETKSVNILTKMRDLQAASLGVAPTDLKGLSQAIERHHSAVIRFRSAVKQHQAAPTTSPDTGVRETARSASLRSPSVKLPPTQRQSISVQIRRDHQELNAKVAQMSNRNFVIKVGKNAGFASLRNPSVQSPPTQRQSISAQIRRDQQDLAAKVEQMSNRNFVIKAGTV